MSQTELTRRLCAKAAYTGLLFLTLGNAGAVVTPMTTPSSAQELVAEKGAAGTFRTIGAYPEERGIGHTVTVLPGGRVFVYGHSPGAKSTDSVILDPKLRSTGRNELAPVIWDPKLRAWRRIEHPPECQFMPYLHTATPLANGKILIAGGICDVPRREEATAHLPHKELSIWNDETRKWEVAPSLVEARIYHTATLLENDGVLFVGGESDIRGRDNTEPVLDSVEIFRAGKILQLPHLNSARAKHTATRMADGSVIVAGGMGKDGKGMSTVEIWDPKSQTWHYGPSLRTPRYRHTASLLSDGRLLVAGGVTQEGNEIASVEILSPSKTTWSEGAPLLLPLRRHSSLVLNNDDVLVVGVGFDREHSFSRAMLWENSTSQWRPAGHLFPDRYKELQSYLLAPAPSQSGDALVFDFRLVMLWSRSKTEPVQNSPFGERDGYVITPLIDGRIMLVGGRNLLPLRWRGKLGVDWVEIFDPKSGQFSVTGRLNQARTSLSALTLDDGRVLVASEGFWQVASPKPQLPNYAEIWDPATGKWSIIKEVSFEGAGWVGLEKFAKLKDGRVLFLFSESDAPDQLRYRATIWDPLSKSVKNTQVNVSARTSASIAINPDGRVFIVGGAFPRKIEIGANAQIWDSRTGRIETLPFPPNWRPYRAHTATLTLKNGNMVWVERTYPSDKTATVAIWNMAAGGWRQLPPLPVDDRWDPINPRLIELSDGSIIANDFWLRPGASSWSAMQRPPQNEATVIELSSGRLLALSSSSPHVAYFNEDSKQWQLEAPYYLQRKDKLKPALLELTDGRLMVSGSLNFEGWPRETATQIWNPKNNTWTAVGRLSGVYTGATEATLLPSGQVLHLGIDRAGNLRCEIGHPSDDIWTDCNAPAMGAPSGFTVGPLQDGRIAFMPTQGVAYVYDEPNKQWLPLSGNVSAMLPNVPKPGANWFPLPDGCFISGPPFRIFNPKTGKEFQPNNPVTGIRNDFARLTALSDGTVIIAGYPEGSNDLGSGFFHRKASCTGFEVQADDEVFMPGIYWTPPTLAATPVAASNPWWQRLASVAEPYKWIPLALVIPFVLYMALRKLVLRMNTADPGLTLPSQVERMTRMVIYALLIGLVLYIAAPLLYRDIPFRSAKTNTATSSPLPCRFIGVWSSSRLGAVHRITLTDDGRYTTSPIRNSAGVTRVFTGFWAVQGDKVVWRHDDNEDGSPDINPIRQERDGAFTLIEENGEHSKFELLERIESSRCAR